MRRTRIAQTLRRGGSLVLCTALLASCGVLRGAPGPSAPIADTTAAAERQARPTGIKEYSQVITEEAETQRGLFVAHRVGDKLYFEIPRQRLGQEFLLVKTVSQNWGGGIDGMQVGRRVLVWEQRGNRILVRSPSYTVTADTAHTIYQAVRATTYAPVLASFSIEAFGPDSAAVVDVTPLFTGGPRELSLASEGTTLERDRTFIERVAVFPENIETDATHTFTITPQPVGGIQGPRTSASALMRFSMISLPEQTMMPRRADSRVGFFSVGRVDFGTDEHRAARYEFITRWRLECPNGESPPCEPVKPIVFYIDPATPDRWVPHVMAGVEDWREAFEGAGFINAIRAKRAPTPEEDPDWSLEDARYSVIRWHASLAENAMGPHVNDPRTGEIIQSTISMYHNVLNLLRGWYFVQMAPLDARASRLPLPDDLMGRLLRYVVAHEVGHAIGLQHNFIASSMYPAESVRNVAFLREMGHVPSIMDYARFNYVAQPEDNIPPELLVPDVGPYDHFAIHWGYAPIPEANTPADERATLDQWAREQDRKPWLRFQIWDSIEADSHAHMEAVGSANPVQSTQLGLKNIQRVVPMLIPATVRDGEDFSDLSEMYGRLVRQWATVLGHVVRVVGSVTSRDLVGGQDGLRYEMRPAADQREAVAFLNENAFASPDFFMDRDILRRIEVQGALERITRAQMGILIDLYQNRRLARMIEFEALAGPGEGVYTVTELAGDLRKGIWTELSGTRVQVAASRRALQSLHLSVLDGKVNPDERTRRFDPVSPDVQALLRADLRALAADIRTAIPRSRDQVTRAHLEAARDRIERILDPRG